MKIYKFKDLNDDKKHYQFYQIVLSNVIWCAKPASLNDEEEFKFKLDYTPSSHTAQLLSKVIERRSATNYLPIITLQNKRLEEIAAPIITDVINNCRNTIGIVSFSTTKTGDHLWSEYGGNGNGACIEIEIPDELVNDRYHPVTYVPEKIYHIDSFLESALLPDKAFITFRNIFLTKTKNHTNNRYMQEQENEIRFISNRQEVYLKIDGCIKEIILGDHIPDNTIKKINDRIISHCRANAIIISNK